MKKLECCPDCCPRAGDVYFCKCCGFTVSVVRGCTCTDSDCVSLACCGEAMKCVNPTP
jgi:hypothetical protein